MRVLSRLLIVVAALLMAVAGVTVAGPSQEASADELVTISFLSPGEESVRMGDFLENEFAERMLEDLNIELDVSWSPWG